MHRRVLVLGRQGAGTGTQCAVLARVLGAPHVTKRLACRRVYGATSAAPAPNVVAIDCPASAG